MSGCRHPGCTLTFAHHHETWPRPSGVGFTEAIIAHSADPNAEVRDPDTGEVIFPARKVPFKLIEGGKTEP